MMALQDLKNYLELLDQSEIKKTRPNNKDKGKCWTSRTTYEGTLVKKW